MGRFQNLSVECILLFYNLLVRKHTQKHEKKSKIVIPIAVKKINPNKMSHIY